MTCVVGVVKDGVITMGADRAGTRESGLQQTRADTKVWEKYGILYGFSGAFRTSQILRHCFSSPDHPPGMRAWEYLCSVFAPAVQQALEKGKAHIDSEGCMGSEFMIGYLGKLYLLCSDFQIASHDTPYSVSGSGAPFALGALYSIFGVGVVPIPDTEFIVRYALKVAAEFDDGTRGPFDIITGPG